MSTMVFPNRRKAPIVETALMHEVTDRTLAVHYKSPIIVWTGQSHLGKTTTATWFRDRINLAYEAENPDAFRAGYYQATEVPAWYHSPDKMAMGAFHSGILGPLDSGLYRRLKPDELAKHIVTGLIKRQIEMAIVDEAGLYSLPALRGLITIRDRAVIQEHPLTIVLIGMDDLPFKITATPQIDERVHEWLYFKSYTLQETIDLATEVTDLWRDADLSSVEVQRQFQFIHDHTDGVAGRIVAFLGKVEADLAFSERELSVAFLKAIHLRTLRAKERAQQAARNGYINPKSSNGEKQKGKGTSKVSDKRKKGGGR